MKKILVGLLILITYSSGIAANLQSSDITYLGAFRLPNTSDTYQFEYAGWALAYYPGGNGGNGSLFTVGSSTSNADVKRDIAEISIPTPVVTATLSDMNTATLLNGFSDLTAGRFDTELSGEALPHMRGLLYMPAQGAQSSEKLYWSFWGAYNSGGCTVDYDGHGYSDINFTTPNPQGPWGYETYHSSTVGGYLFEIPDSWADTHISSRYIATGITREGDQVCTSKGPALFAAAIYDYTDASPPASNQLPNTPLLYYPTTTDSMTNYSASDEWRGGAWVVSGDKSAVIFVGKKSTGISWYGTSPNGDNVDACSSAQGYHSTEWQHQLLFYSTTDLESVAAGTIDPHDPQPYSAVNITSTYLNDNYNQCKRFEGLAYDRDNNRIYMIMYQGDGSKPLIHVFQIGTSSVARTQFGTTGLTSQGSTGITTLQ